MRGKKELLADILFNSNLVNLFRRLPIRNKLLVLNYHRVRPNDPGFSTAFDEALYNLNADEFARQIRWLKQNTRLFSERDLIDHFREGGGQNGPTSRPCVLITFDDGYRDNYDIVYPILREFEAPAVIFITTQMVHDRRLAWWDVIAYLIKQCGKPAIECCEQVFPMDDPGKRMATAFFQQRMKRERYEHTKYLLDELSDACGVPPPDLDLQDREIMTWAQIREMTEHNIAIGSHTHTHRVLSTIPPNFQKEEMILSKILIEEQIGQPVFSISYPVGERQFIANETAEIAASCGYMFGFTTNTGVNDWRSVHPYRIRRTARLLEKVSTVSLLTILPELFTWDSAAAVQLSTMEIHPTYADAYYRLGIIHLGQGRIEQAIQNFQQAIDFNPDYMEARIKLGLSQAVAGRFDEAERNFRFIIEQKPFFADVYYYLGIVHAGQEAISEAVRSLERAVEINPNYKDAILKLGVLYCRRESYNRALQMLEKSSQLDPSDPDLSALVQAGRKIIADHGEASSELSSLFSFYIGGIEHIDELIKGFVSHLNISPNLNDIMSIVEKGTFPEDNLENLLLLFQEYKALFPGYSDIYFMLGVLFRKLGQADEAEKAFLEAIRLNPRYVKARLHYFNLLREQGRFGEAIEHGIVLEGFNLPYPDLYSGLAETCLGLNRNAEAERFAEKALAMNPTFARAKEAWAQVQTRRHSQAV